MSRNGRGYPRRPRIEMLGSSASPEEAAAIAAAIEQFVRESAPAPISFRERSSPWLRAGLYENAGLGSSGPSPWGDPEPWGRPAGEMP